MNYKEIIEYFQFKFKTKNNIPLHNPVFTGNEKKYVLETIDSTFVSSVGSYVDKSEKLISEICNTKSAVAIVNGTSSLQIGLLISGVSHGDEVITQALSFVATANAIKYCGADPIFLDVDYETMGLSPKSVSEFLTEFCERRDNGTYNKKTGKRIAACVPMHTFGFPVHLNELISICDDWNIPIIEDAAESFGSLYKNKHTGSFGKTGTCSFNGNKVVTCGGGGMLVTNDINLGIKAKHLTTTAKIPHTYEYIHDSIGFNFRLPNLNAALLCAQLEQIEVFLERKRKLALEYYNFFENQNFKFRTELENTKVNYWLMCIELNNLNDRNEFLKITNESKITTRPIWRLLCELPMYQNCYRDSQKNAKYLSERIVNIPSSVIL